MTFIVAMPAHATVPDDAPLRASEVEPAVRTDGTIVLEWPAASAALEPGRAEAAAPLDRQVPNVVDWLPVWASQRPDALFMAERDERGQWCCVTWSEAWHRVQCIATALLGREPRRIGRPLVVAVLTANSVRQALLTFAALHAGLTVAPVSPGYVSSSETTRLATVMNMLEPDLVYAERLEGSRVALASLGWPSERRIDAAAIDAWCRDGRIDADALARAHACAHGDAVAKIMFTSGSTGIPKGVVTSHAMLAAAQATSAANLLRLPERPAYVEWLPWHHVMGGNVNLNRILRFGAAAWLDAGRPVPGRFEPTLANLRDIAPTFYFTVPLGYSMLIPALESDAALAQRFFSRLEYVSYGGATLPLELVRRFDRLALQHTGRRIAFTSAYGATETSGPGLTTGPGMPSAGALGMPSPGVAAKLVPNGDRFELRLRGANVRALYLGQGAAGAAGCDEEGFYRTGDAVQWVDPAQPRKGLAFAGRISEDFKLASGTWVNVTAVRARLLEALTPLATDAAIAGHDRAHVGALVFIDAPACRKAIGSPAERTCATLARDGALAQALAGKLASFNAGHAGSSQRVERLVVLPDAPDADAFEITDKGYLNQRAVLQRRATDVERLYADGAPAILLPES
jgi:feruloyl-CoA synthase